MKRVFAFAWICCLIEITWSIQCKFNNYLPCAVDDKCIRYTKLCDGIRDCNLDGSDEDFCTSDKEKSRKNYLRQKGLKYTNGSALYCIQPGYQYTGTRRHCVEQTSPIQCYFPSYLPCPVDDKCISYAWLCDGEKDCNSDGTDEDFCTSDKDASREDFFKQKGLKFDKENHRLSCIQPGYNYTKNRNFCVDIDECSNTKLNNCEQVCVNNPGSFSCACNYGYQLAENGRDCKVDKCSDSSLNCEQICVKKEGSFSCACTSGYKLAKNGRACKDIDECANNPCSDFCVNTVGSFHCLCKTGYKIQNVFNCTDIDECENNPCSQICTNYAGGFRCSCRNGYVLADDASTCIDVNECSDSSLCKCEQICVNNPGSFYCACQSGYRLDDNGKTCSDVDECSRIPRVCSQTCLNNVGNYTCECVLGYVMPEGQPNSCEAQEGNTKTIYVTENNDIILQLTGTDDKFNLTRRANVVLKRFFYWASTQEILWLETYSKGGAILSLPLGRNQTNKPRILIDIDHGNPADMAIDSVTNKLYVTDSEQTAVLVYDMFFASRKTLVNITAHLPSTIVLDTKNRFFYYIDLHERHRGIYKSKMDGEGDCIPFITSNVGRPSDMFLDETSALLYWADSLLMKIEMVSLDGKVRKILLASNSNPAFKEPISISIYEDSVYWSQSNSLHIYSTNKRNYNGMKKIASEKAEILKVLVTSSSQSKFVRRINSCDLKMCKQMCLLGPNDTAKCVCFTGYTMKANKTLCTPTFTTSLGKV